MATPGQLCSHTAQLLGLEPNTAATAWRLLRENSKVTTGGRGRSASHCVPADAANLLIAVIGKLPLKSIFSSWERYSALPVRTSNVSVNSSISLMKDPLSKRWQLDIPEFRELKARHSFSEALGALIASVTSTSLYSVIMNWDGDISRFSQPFVQVRFFGPFPQAEIAIGKTGTDPDIFTQRIMYSDIPEDFPELHGWADTPRPVDEAGDLNQIMIISEKTIFGLGELLRQEATVG
jgi:hypothetical protein